MLVGLSDWWFCVIASIPLCERRTSKPSKRSLDEFVLSFFEGIEGTNHAKVDDNSIHVHSNQPRCPKPSSIIGSMFAIYQYGQLGVIRVNNYAVQETRTSPPHACIYMSADDSWTLHWWGT